MKVKFYYLKVLTTRGWRYVTNEGGFGTKRFQTIEEAQAHGRMLKRSCQVLGVPYKEEEEKA